MDEGRLEKDIVLVIGITKTEKKKRKEKKKPFSFPSPFSIKEERKKKRFEENRKYDSYVTNLWVELILENQFARGGYSRAYKHDYAYT